jgi:hypothetical protein
MRCSIHIDEIDGKLHIIGNIPSGAEKTIAAALTQALLDASAGIMNRVLGENKRPERVDLQ